MTARTQEATDIVRIAIDYLPPDRLYKMAIRLDEEVGKKSLSLPIRETLSCLRQEVEAYCSGNLGLSSGYLDALIPNPAFGPDILPYPGKKTTWHWLLAFLLLWLFHTALIAANLVAFLVLPFWEPWYLAIPVCCSVFWATFTPVKCVLTGLENTLRSKLGWPTIKGFVGYYFLGKRQRHKASAAAI